jgi:hypothetical protein
MFRDIILIAMIKILDAQLNIVINPKEIDQESVMAPSGFLFMVFKRSYPLIRIGFQDIEGLRNTTTRTLIARASG